MGGVGGGSVARLPVDLGLELDILVPARRAGDMHACERGDMHAWAQEDEEGARRGVPREWHARARPKKFLRKFCAAFPGFGPEQRIVLR